MPPSSILGKTLGHYRVVELIGAGGMGEVYRARDARLDRDVALKILPPAFCQDEERLRRFGLEARAAAALNHPNIVAIFDIGVQDGSPYIVSELLEGVSLRNRLAGGPLSPRQAVESALQIVRGLAAAHEKGIIHRDLKPENLFITRDGRVKILDFGLAKLTETNQPRTESDAVTMASTTGVILGTVGYMSPEQLRGKGVDHRTDIFSFGAVFYEMLSGRHAFSGETNADTIISILKEDPLNLPGTTPQLPAAMEQIARHCLEKDPDARFQSAHDLAFALEAVASGATTSALPSSPTSKIKVPTGGGLGRWIVGAIAAVVLIGLGVYMAQRGQNRPLPTYHQLTFRRGTVWSARFASDGHTIVYSATWNGNSLGIFSTLPQGIESRSLGLDGADLLGVSSTGEMAVLLHAVNLIHFINSGTLARVPLGGGSPREVLNDVVQADWSPDGSNLAVVHQVGERQQLEFPIGTVLYQTRGSITYPRISPDGERIAFMEHDVADDSRGWVTIIDLAGKKRRLSEEWEDEQGLAWSPDGKEIWFTASKAGEAHALHVVTLSGKERVAARVPINLMIHDIARDGSILLASYGYSTPVIALPPGQARERDLTALDGVHIFDLSADGQTFVMQYYGEGSGTNYSSYLGKVDGSSPVRLGDGAAIALSPDGKWVLAALNFPHRQTILLPTGPGQIRYLEHPSVEDMGDGGWLPDSRQVLFTGREAGRPARSYIQDIEGGKARAVTPEGITGAGLPALVSPDGRLFVALDASGKRVLYPLAGGERQPIQGLNPDDAVIRWAQDGRSLFIYHPEEHTRIYLLDPTTGRRQLVRDFLPSDPAGILGGPKVLVSADGKWCLYSFERYLSQLYLVKGLLQ
ncbi:MAG TPA: protein kinase [Terriglobales bacterium]|nr:protein kinase [Terriglobales bacterium]